MCSAGSGKWNLASQIVAVDAVAEVLKLNEQRVNSAKVHYLQANIFTLQLAEQFDEIFFSFWLSHVPGEYFEGFWQTVARLLKPGGRVFFIDSCFEPSSTAKDQQLKDRRQETTLRRLNDGRQFQIYKIFYEPQQLQERLNGLGWKMKVEETPHYFIFGNGEFSG